MQFLPYLLTVYGNLVVNKTLLTLLLFSIFFCQLALDKLQKGIIIAFYTLDLLTLM